MEKIEEIYAVFKTALISLLMCYMIYQLYKLCHRVWTPSPGPLPLPSGLNETEMDSIEEIQKGFIAYKIRGLNIKPVNKSPFAEEVAQYIDSFLKENNLKLVKSLLEFGDYAFTKIKSREAFYFIQIYDYFAFFLDDYLDYNPKEFERFVKYFIDGECPANTPLELMIQWYFNECKRMVENSLISEEFVRQHNDLMIEWLQYFPKNQFYNYVEHSLTDQEFVEARITDIHCSTQMFIFTLDTSLIVTEDIKRNEDYIGLNREVTKNAIFINELFSFIKECGIGHGKSNYVYIKIKNNNMTVQQSMDQIVLEAKEAERMAHFYANKLIASNNEGLAKYAKILPSLMDGNAFWSTFCRRYNNPEFQFYTND